MTLYVLFSLDNREPIAGLLNERLHELDLGGDWGIATVPNCQAEDMAAFQHAGRVFGSLGAAQDERFKLLSHEDSLSNLP